MMRTGLRSKLVLSFLAMVCFTAAMSLVAEYSIDRIVQGKDLMADEILKLSIVGDMHSNIDRAIRSLASYGVTGKESDRLLFEQSIFACREALDSLDDLQSQGRGELNREGSEILEKVKVGFFSIEKNTDQFLRVAKSLDLSQRRETISDFIETLKDMKAGEKAQLTPEQLGGDFDRIRKLSAELIDVQEILGSGQLIDMADDVKTAFREVAENLARFRQVSLREAMAASSEANLAERRAEKFLVGSIIITLITALVLGLVFSHLIYRPIRALSRSAKLVGKGALDHRIQIKSRDEIWELAGEFNAMAERLERSYGELESKVRERTRELKISNEFLISLFDGITDGISVNDRDFRIVNVNQGLARLMGEPPIKLAGRLCYRTYGNLEEPCPGCPALMTFETGLPHSVQLGWKWADGRKFEAEIFIFPLFGEKREVVSVIEYIKDITEKKLMEKSLLQSEKLAGIGRFAAGVAHEIRNPLGIIKSSASLIKKGKGISDEERELADFIMGEVDRLNKVVTDLLDFAKPSRPQVRRMKLRDVAGRTIALTSKKCRDRGIEIVADYREKRRVAIDGEQMEQVFLNLILNSMDAIDGRGEIRIGTRDDGEEGVTVEFSDTGSGISGGGVGRIFEPFFTTKEGGTGLGLAIVYRIVESHQGTISVESEEGKGTSFIITFPSA